MLVHMKFFHHSAIFEPTLGELSQKEKIKEFKANTYSLDVDVLRKLEEYSKETMIPKTRIIEQAIIEYIDKRKNNK